ncbi:hypothetical protein J5N97_020805 [Dioscorea zingiberensis]|uniref:Uncharacterized protein n=1 Tax=Dioscorea zingiberensis TaxID=325984 RepID=A0A9D5CGG2_9LILI|nr:hypothetical protein J5N97_020805 [Dioscorea zingiberensis]
MEDDVGTPPLRLVNFISEEQVAKFIDPQDACSAISVESHRLWLEHGNRTDDITIIVVHIKDLGTETIDVPNQTSNRSSQEILDKGNDENTALQGSDICHPDKGKLPKMQPCPLDSSTERSPASVAPSPTHTLLRNGAMLEFSFSMRTRWGIYGLRMVDRLVVSHELELCITN